MSVMTKRMTVERIPGSGGSGALTAARKLRLNPEPGADGGLCLFVTTQQAAYLCRHGWRIRRPHGANTRRVRVHRGARAASTTSVQTRDQPATRPRWIVLRKAIPYEKCRNELNALKARGLSAHEVTSMMDPFEHRAYLVRVPESVAKRLQKKGWKKFERPDRRIEVSGGLPSLGKKRP